MTLYRKLIRPMHCYPGHNYEPLTEPVEKEEKWYPEEEREFLEKKYASYNEGSFSDLVFEQKFEPYALELLKEQEPVEPIPPKDESDLWRCGNCNNQLFRCTHQRYCEMCGREVKWNDNK